MRADLLARHIRPGDTLAAAQVLGEPTELLETLIPELRSVDGLRLFVGMSLTDVLRLVPPNVQLISSVGMSPNAELIADGLG